MGKGSDEIQLPDKEKVYWVRDDMVNIVDGLGFCVAPTGEMVCIGPVDIEGFPLKPLGAVGNALLSLSDEKERVAKIVQVENHIDNDSQNQNDVIMQHRKRGRPLKPAGEQLHRSTIFRRKQKEKQGVLFTV